MNGGWKGKGGRILREHVKVGIARDTVAGYCPPGVGLALFLGMAVGWCRGTRTGGGENVGRWGG